MSGSLSPCPTEVQVQGLVAKAERIILVVQVIRRTAACPQCAQPSRRIHSYYERRLADLPWSGVPVEVRLRTRRFFCESSDCAQRIFTERLPGTVAVHARRTLRMAQAVRWLGLALGGAAGARAAQRLGLTVSGSTVLRHLRRILLAQDRNRSAPRVLGMDDWAWRKGRSYGTILCDLERGRVVDLLADRRSNTVIEWLRDHHPPPEVISRDRAGTYADAARRGAPQAVQVADRWHLLRNLHENLEHLLAGYASMLERAFRQTLPWLPASNSIPAKSPIATRSQQISRERRQKRWERYQKVIQLHQRGQSSRAIARQLGLNRGTVRHWLGAGQFPERVIPRRHSSVDPWGSYVERRWEEGCHNGNQLWRELRAQGAEFARVTLRRWIRARLGTRERHRDQLPPTGKRPTPRQTSALLIGFYKDPSPTQQSFVENLCAFCPDLAASAAVGREFYRMVRKRDLPAWEAWQTMAEKSPLHNFAAQLKHDEAAVRAALSLPWSTGPVEGHIHRLKLIKRQMYGRAKLDLLRVRLLNAA